MTLCKMRFSQTPTYIFIIKEPRPPEKSRLVRQYIPQGNNLYTCTANTSFDHCPILDYNFKYKFMFYIKSHIIKEFSV